MAHIRLKKMRKIATKGGVKKQKSKSSTKKRFSLTALGKILSTQANKRHNMVKHSSRQRKAQKGTVILSASIERVIKKYCRILS